MQNILQFDNKLSYSDVAVNTNCQLRFQSWHQTADLVSINYNCVDKTRRHHCTPRASTPTQFILCTYVYSIVRRKTDDVVARQRSSATQSFLCSERCGRKVGLGEEGGSFSGLQYNIFSQRTWLPRFVQVSIRGFPLRVFHQPRQFWFQRGNSFWGLHYIWVFESSLVRARGQQTFSTSYFIQVTEVDKPPKYWWVL